MTVVREATVGDEVFDALTTVGGLLIDAGFIEEGQVVGVAGFGLSVGQVERVARMVDNARAHLLGLPVSLGETAEEITNTLWVFALARLARVSAWPPSVAAWMATSHAG